MEKKKEGSLEKDSNLGKSITFNSLKYDFFQNALYIMLKLIII